jgi:hypothetical protein
MADIASVRASHVDPNESHDGTILLLAAVGILAIFLVIALTSSSGIGHGPEYVPTMFGF